MEGLDILFIFIWVSLIQLPMPTLSNLIDELVAIRMPTTLLAVLITLSLSISQIDSIQLVQGSTVNAWIVFIHSLIIATSS